jgi:hypothetical protein
MFAQVTIIILAIALIIAGPIITIVIINFLLAQMFVSFIPIQITIWNWLAIMAIGMFGVAGTRGGNST